MQAFLSIDGEYSKRSSQGTVYKERALEKLSAFLRKNEINYSFLS